MQYLYHPLDKVFITQEFGKNPDHYAQYGLKGHDGIDYRVKFIDSPLGKRYVSAAADGVCLVRFDRHGYGTHIRITHSDGSITIYGHLSKVYRKTGDKVLAQQIIGISGNTGDSTGAHVHFEYRPFPIKSTNGYAGAVDQTPFMIATMPVQFMTKPEPIFAPISQPVVIKSKLIKGNSDGAPDLFAYNGHSKFHIPDMETLNFLFPDVKYELVELDVLAKIPNGGDLVSMK